MERNAILVLTLVVLFAGMYAVSSSSIAVAPENQLNAGLIHIGSVDGKRFYIDPTKGTWATAKLNCQKAYMRLASITSAAQEDLLREADNEVFANEYWWTAGRDALTLQQLVWDHNQQPVNTSSSIPLVQFPSINTCLLFKSLGANSTYHMFTCTPVSQLDMFGSLCEINDACSNFRLN